jgi:hypothetical protein
MTGRLAALLGGALWLALASGCISAPDVVLVDHKTALELQASGRHPRLEAELERAGIQPKVEDIPAAALPPGRLGAVARLVSAERSDAERIDGLLRAHCIGEGLDGLLRRTPEHCSGEVEPAQVTRAVERANLHRRQVWRFLQQQVPDADPQQVRRAWIERHRQRVVCGGWIEVAAGRWEAKKC